MLRYLTAAAAPPLLLLTASVVHGQSAENDALETVIVTGTARSLEADRAEAALTPGGVALIDIDDFRERSVGSLADVLRFVPGVWSASDTGNDNIFFSSRGSNLDATDWDMNGIKLLQDGLPVTAADGNNHNRIIDPLAARHAVFARGANALTYGASTLGGAVNFVTPTARDGAGTSVMLNGGSHGQRIVRLSAGRVFSDAWDGAVTLEAKSWDGYREHNEQDRAGVYANAGWRASDTVDTRFFLTLLSNDQALAGSLSRARFEADPDRASPAAIGGNYQLDVETQRLANRTQWQLGPGRSLDFGASIERQTLFHPIVDRVLVDFDGPGPAPPVELFSLLIDTDHQDVGAMLRYSHVVGSHDLLVGLNYGQNDVEGEHYRNLNGRRNGLSTLIDNDAASLEIFAADRWRIGDATTLVLAAQAVSAERQVRNVNVGSGAVTRPGARYSGFNPRIGLIRDVGAGGSLYANLSRLFEPPTNFELEDNVAGRDATLDEMHGTVLEIGYRGSRRASNGMALNWDVTWYSAYIDDEILSVEDPNAPGTSLVTNVERTRHAGIEASLAATVPLAAGRSLDTLLSLSVNDFTFESDPVWGDNDLPAAPEHVVRGEVAYRMGSGFYIGPTVDLVGSRFADFANSYAIDDYTIWGLRTGWAGSRWSAFAEIRNLGDETYVVSHSVRNRANAADAILNAGEPLSIYVGTQVRFE